MDLYRLPEIKIVIFGLIFLRMIGFVISAAIIGSSNIGVSLKVLLSLVLTMTIFSNLDLPSIESSYDDSFLIMYAIREIAIGLICGFLTRLFYFCITMVGDMTSVTMGLGSAQLFNPAMGQMGNVMEQFFSIFATLIFFTLNGHHLLLTAIAESFSLIPVATLKFEFKPFGEITLIVQKLLEIVIKICGPILASALIANFAMGILGRIIPQINVQFSIAPITIMLGFGVIFLSLPLLSVEMSQLFGSMMSELYLVMKAL